MTRAKGKAIAKTNDATLEQRREQYNIKRDELYRQQERQRGAADAFANHSEARAHSLLQDEYNIIEGGGKTYSRADWLTNVEWSLKANEDVDLKTFFKTSFNELVENMLALGFPEQLLQKAIEAKAAAAGK